jgi:hypothetical protein
MIFDLLVIALLVLVLQRIVTVGRNVGALQHQLSQLALDQAAPRAATAPSGRAQTVPSVVPAAPATAPVSWPGWGRSRAPLRR